ncbi:HAMP domain-containing sensor histidine kinase [Mucilaginibacter koreensis]
MIVGLFCVLQYLLIIKTYRLEKGKYVSEIREAIVEHLREPIENVHSRAVTSIIEVVKDRPALSKNILAAIRTQIAKDNQAQRLALSSAIRKVPELNHVHYNLSYFRILLWQGNNADTLLSDKELPVEVAGEHILPQKRLLISNGAQSTTFDLVKANGQSITCTLEVSIRQYADLADWRSQALKRLTATFLLGAGLVILIVLVLYGIIAALLRQKKIADMKTDFAHNITHELKTPLSTAGIIIKTLGIIDAAKDKEAFHQQLLSLEKQHSKIAKTVDQVLESAMTGPLHVNTGSVDVRAWLNDLVDNQPVAMHQLQIECNGDQLIFTDETLLASIIGNLLDNAIKYSQPGTAIIIRFYTTGKTCIVEVEDEGETIPQQYRSYLFDKFYRIPEKEDNHTVKGLGLGLYLSQKNAAALGGQLKYQPTLEGNCFQLILPGNEI